MGAGAGVAGFLELLLMNTSKHATCETARVGAEAAWCCALRLSNREQHRGLAARVTAVVVVVVVVVVCWS